jgi:hypothetical protein
MTRSKRYASVAITIRGLVIQAGTINILLGLISKGDFDTVKVVVDVIRHCIDLCKRLKKKTRRQYFKE